MQLFKTIGSIAVATCAAIAVADVTSANVVGYSESETPAQNCFVAAVATFSPVGDATGETMTLGKLTPVAIREDKPIMPGNFTLQFIDEYGDVAELWDEEIYPPIADLDEDDVVYATFGYVTPAYATEYSVANGPGWYLKHDITFSYPQNDIEIPIGSGYEFQSTAKGSAKLQYNGQVLKIGLEASGDQNCFIATGNATPTDLCLEDFTVKAGREDKPVTPGTFTLEFIDEYGDVAELWDEEQYPPIADLEDGDVVYATYGFVTPAYATEYSVANGPGWYLKHDITFSYPQNKLPMPAGQGVFVQSTAKGSAALQIPQILKD